MKRKYRKLLKQLESENAKTRYDAVLALGQSGETEFIDELDRIATLDANPKVRDLAAKAVRTLKVLRQREIEKERQARLASESDEPDNYNWPSLSHEKLMRTERENVTGDANWSYAEAKRVEEEGKLKAAREREAEEKAAKRRKARRARFRLILMLTFTLAIIALGIVYIPRLLDSTDKPENRLNAMEELQRWAQSQQAALLIYQPAMVSEPINCVAVREATIPEQPEWATPDEPLLEGFETPVTELTNIQASLTTVRDAMTPLCEGRDTLPQAEWGEYGAMYNLVVSALNNTYPQVSAIDAEIQTLLAEQIQAAEATPAP